MKPLDRLLALNPGLLGIAGYILALLARNRGGWVVPMGIAALIGLVTASLATWRAEWSIATFFAR
jgi:hypothetical protein